MTQPTTQAIQQAREIAAEVAEAMEGCLCDDCMDHGTRIIAQALSVSASEREALEARVKELEEALQNARGFLDTPISRRRNQGDSFYQETINSIRAALNGATRP